MYLVMQRHSLSEKVEKTPVLEERVSDQKNNGKDSTVICRNIEKILGSEPKGLEVTLIR